ncbi:MAG: glycosyltransferase family 4 protein, partial [Actinomycetota bacterium]|nr:glycosyltransferase family 4 protein [Actinomycetota bacterium]
AWWTQVALPRRARAAGADVLHHPLPALARRTPCPQVVTVHDLAFERLPEAFDPRFRAFARRAHRRAVRRAAAVVCPSRTTAMDVAALWGVPWERIVVAPHGPGQEPAPRPDPPPAEEHFLYVGDAEPRKNLKGLLAGYGRYRAEGGDVPLVLAGSAEVRADGVRAEGRVDSARLADLYARALVLVHPALHEGFGMTPLEAMHAGVPVLAARSPGVTETCGDAADYFDPRDPDALARELEAVAGDADRRADLCARGARRAVERSWAESARRHLEAYTVTVR